MKRYKLVKIKNIIKLFKFKKNKSVFKDLINFSDTICKSYELSILNLFFQFVNFTILWLLIIIFIPSFLDPYLNNLIVKFLFYITCLAIKWVINLFFSLKWALIFDTEIKLTLLILFILCAIIIIIYFNLIKMLVVKVYKDCKYYYITIYKNLIFKY